MMEIGTHPLPDEVLVQTGKFASTWAAIEQTIVLDTTDILNFKNRYKVFEPTRLEFRRLRKKWLELRRDMTAPEKLSTLERINDRLAKASESRGFFLHGVWRKISSDTWGLHGGAEYEVFWWEQRDKPLERFVLQTNLHEITNQNIRVEALRCDLLAFLNGKHR